MTGTTPAASDVAARHRQLANKLLEHELDAEEADQLVRRLDEALAIVGASAPHIPRPRDDLPAWWSGEHAEGEWIHHGETCFGCGPLHPAGLRLRLLKVGPERLRGIVLVERLHGVESGHAHGGAVSAIFDDAFGAVFPLLGRVGFTGELAVRFEAPTPIGRELTIEVEVTARERRKIFAQGEIRDGATVTAHATATMIADAGHPGPNRDAPPEST